MHSREQYLAALREEYRRASTKEKTRLNEVRKSTRPARKVLIRKLAHPAKLQPARPNRRASYGPEVVTALELFDFACGQRHCARRFLVASGGRVEVQR
jgi:hypothetical protein